jgi:hypothetical protein
VFNNSIVLFKCKCIMKTFISFLLVVFLSCFSCLGQENYWKQFSDTSSISEGVYSILMKTSNTPVIYQLDSKAFLKALKSLEQGHNVVELQIPDNNGNFDSFNIYRYDIMDSVLADKYPEVRTYKGISQSERKKSVYISTTSLGIKIILRNSESEDELIDLVDTTKQLYAVFNREDAIKRNNQVDRIGCLGVETGNKAVVKSMINNLVSTRSDGKIREYRFAVATTIEYSKYYLRRTSNMQADMRTKKAIILSAVVQSVLRLNSVLESDLGIRLKLVANNDKILFIDDDDFSNNNAYALLEESQKVIDTEIGFDNYDLGHTMSTGAGGMASLGGLGTNRKAKGVTGSSVPMGDRYDIDFVLHEVGHQLGANHTFTNYHNGAVSYGTVYEPGSGSTIMGYAGISKPNVQDYADAYFHFISLEEMKIVIQGQNHSGKIVEEKLPVPKVNGGKDYVIPLGTPFKLEGTVANGYDMQLVYTWEQADRGLLNQPPQSHYKEGANFRSIQPSESSVRYFPAYIDVLEGKLKTEWEVLPTVDREMHFVFTARDLSNYNGGVTASDGMALRIANVGPFEITQFGNVNSNGMIEVNEGGKTTIKWSAFGTDSNGINTKFIDIYLSKDDGVSYELIKKAVFNNGSTEVNIPYGLADQCRILLQPIDNVYYAVSKSFKIVSSVSDKGVINALNKNILIYPNPVVQNTFVSFKSTSGQEIVITLYDLSMRQVYKKHFLNKEKFHQEIDLGNLERGVYVITVEDGEAFYSEKVVIKK